MTTPEGRLKKEVCSQLRKWGCTVLQYRQDSTTVKGFADTIVLLPEALTIFIEFKASRNAKFQPLQKEWHQKLLDRGFFSFICYPENKSEILNQIKELL